MAWKGFTGGAANIQPAAFIAVYIRPSGAKWQTLGAINSGVLNVRSFASGDSLTRNKGINSLGFTAKCNMMQAALIELELLDSICAGTNDFLFKLSDAVAITGVASAGWVLVSAAQVGVKAKIVGDGTPEDNRHIELEWQGSIYNSDANVVALLKPTLAAGDFEATGTGGTFHAIGVYTAATDGGNPDISHIKPCGVASVTLDAPATSSPDTITPIQNVKLGLEMLANQDGLLRFLPNSLDINIEYDWMATGNGDLLLLDNASQSDVKVVVTMIDGVVFTFDNQTGIETNFEASGDMDKNRVVRFTHKGKVLQASLDGIVS